MAATAEGLACAMRIPMAKESDHLSGLIGNPVDYVMPCFISIGYLADEADSIGQININIEEKSISINGK